MILNEKGHFVCKFTFWVRTSSLPPRNTRKHQAVVAKPPRPDGIDLDGGHSAFCASDAVMSNWVYFKILRLFNNKTVWKLTYHPSYVDCFHNNPLKTSKINKLIPN